MNRIKRIQSEIDQCKNDRHHLGACTTSGKSDEEIAHIDERFFLACEKFEALKAGLERSRK
ncbi:hypothetical protein CDG60_12305 [Acinetobacter chinensis]|uniref:Uncharacterized protein n=1 Tax=Acinetobacter chinensis TaxID=2004650 RepID=A0A3B7M429_9GAMM|nr:hypothetical protein [Acinetobacter chinensis]AXY57279.1 hypothetical protein CDG60_12305 [Acinetobacter chinensis]